MKIFLLFASVLISFFASAQTEVKWLTHKDSGYDLSIQYPSDWQLKPPGPKNRFFVTSYQESGVDKFRENLNCITPRDVEKGFTIQMAKDKTVKALSENFSDFKIINSGYSKWNNVSSFEIEYTYKQTSDNTTYNLHMLQKMAIIKGKFYTLTYTSLSDSYEKYISTIRRMIQSFKVL